MKQQESKGSCSDCGYEKVSHRVMSQYIKIMRQHRNFIDQRLSRTGVYRSQHQILMTLSDYSNESQKELAEHIGVSAATIAVSVKKLEKGGYITRVVDEDDNRINKLCLTEKGEEIVIYSRQFFRNVEAQMFHGFTIEELLIMEQYLDRMCDNLSQIPTDTRKTERED